MPARGHDTLEARLLAALARRRKPVATADLPRAARVSREERPAVAPALEALEARGAIVRTRGDRVALPATLGLVAGRLNANAKGFAFCIPDDPDADDVYIPASRVRPAMHGDRVLVSVEHRHRGIQGEVERVLERGTQRLLGVLRTGRTTGVLVPRDQRVTAPILVPTAATGGARDGDMVVAEIVRHPGRASDAEARVVAVLGTPSDPRVETEAVIHAHGLPVEFPPEVRTAARRLAAHPPATPPGRLDLRAVPLVTIDGETARDFDDAIHVEPHGSGHRLTVAIADVAHYVPPGSPLDVEARARGTSVYFPDRAIPMLPEELSNGLCSLVPGEDRLVEVVRLECDARGHVTAAAFDAGVMRSAARLTYTQVRRTLVDGDPEVRASLGSLVPMLERAEALALALAARRRARGALDLDLPEPEIELDDVGRPVRIVRAERSIANRIIEELMLAANEAVATELARRRLPFVHRVHAPPGEESVRELARFLEGFGLRLETRGGPVTPRAFQAVLERVAGRPEERLVNLVLLRTMQQARYATESSGHFGLATERYTHFTSPIRRYPDLVVHRVLGAALRGVAPPPMDLAAIAEESSRRERVAMDAEREIVQVKRVQLMLERIGETHEGFVSGVASFGFFVELRDVFVEGLVPMGALGDDFYEHDEGRHLLRGRRTGRTFRVGDPVRVTVAGASVERRQVDLVVADVGPRRDPWRRRRRSRY